MFTITLRRPFDFEIWVNKWVNKWVNNLSEKQIIILKAIHEIKEVKKSTLQQLADFIGTAIDINLEVLKKEGLLEREETKGGV
jgi:ATP-dependent DNA helicase RecG